MPREPVPPREALKDKKGSIVGLYDKTVGREVLPKGERANVLKFYDDRNENHDAWDFAHNYADVAWEAETVSVEVVESGPVVASVRVVRKNDNTSIVQDIVLGANSPRLEFVTHVDWQQKTTLLKALFPVDVRASRATYEIQYATIERVTHQNTPYDGARFEVAAQRWTDLSEGDYGVSLLNDCKYGHYVKGNELQISLLRAPVSPDPTADEGLHDFTYALYPHEGDWRVGTVQQGLELNVPLLAVAVQAHSGSLPSVDAFASVDVDNVVLDNVKRAEDSDALIVRVYRGLRSARRRESDVHTRTQVDRRVRPDGRERRAGRSERRKHPSLYDPVRASHPQSTVLEVGQTRGCRQIPAAPLLSSRESSTWME